MSRQSRRRESPRHLVPLEGPTRPGPTFGLLLLNAVFPGAPRFIRGGNTWLRWLFLVIPAIFWAAAAYVGVSVLVDKTSAISRITHPGRSMAVLVGLASLSLWYVITYLDIFGLVRFPRLRSALKVGTVVVLVPLLLFTAGGTGYAAYLVNLSRNALADIFSGPVAGGADDKPVTPFLNPIDGRYNFLVMGGDAGEDRVGRRPDSIMAISVDATTGAAATISLPRNFQGAPFPASSPLKKVFPTGFSCGDECIIGNLYSKVSENYASLYPGAADPSAKAMMETVGEILGLTMQAFVIVDMDNFSQLVDLFGGVKINAGGWVPISGEAIGINGLHLPPEGWIAPGAQTLDGYHALWYARSREWTTDYARSSRQQCVVQALVKQMDPLKVLTKFGELAKAGTQIMESDITTEQLGTFVGLALKSQGQEVKKLTLGPPDFGIEFSTYPDFAQIKSRVSALLGKTPPADSTPASGAPTQQASGGASSTPAVPPTSQAPGGSNSSSTPPVTEQYLQQLARNGNSDSLVSLLANNGNCTPG
ncbi:transcriptional regulator, LytR family [Renibacterium salmoninarum ATCC 33209]|uniref:Transcriptional regulator, LytR family n=1 Tax=Renibacterium salmoninarum (strain ATCC 33209 / DSM 20767 / JCM 11484 / NBRC 15589 / NCIMB 2235) TaxID=288705 RepID=A9WRW4_RENSM|nr:LCP family protein [Renibacterium salmoninarum]ABY24396.1 transcriptional regulator, LytR family [Renibacterium salmoninarum ATCC 33209]